jgi:hypothetical protein
MRGRSPLFERRRRRISSSCGSGCQAIARATDLVRFLRGEAQLPALRSGGDINKAFAGVLAGRGRGIEELFPDRRSHSRKTNFANPGIPMRGKAGRSRRRVQD